MSKQLKLKPAMSLCEVGESAPRHLSVDVGLTPVGTVAEWNLHPGADKGSMFAPPVKATFRRDDFPHPTRLGRNGKPDNMPVWTRIS